MNFNFNLNPIELTKDTQPNEDTEVIAFNTYDQKVMVGCISFLKMLDQYCCENEYDTLYNVTHYMFIHDLFKCITS